MGRSRSNGYSGSLGRVRAAVGGCVVNVRIVGKPDAESDAAVSRFLEGFLEREHLGTAWSVRERPRAGDRLKPRGDSDRRQRGRRRGCGHGVGRGNRTSVPTTPADPWRPSVPTLRAAFRIGKAGVSRLGASPPKGVAAGSRCSDALERPSGSGPRARPGPGVLVLGRRRSARSGRSRARRARRPVFGPLRLDVGRDRPEGRDNRILDGLSGDPDGLGTDAAGGRCHR